MAKKLKREQISKHVEKVQKRLKNEPFWFREENPLSGKCQTNAALADDLGGVTYDTREASPHGSWGHTVCIVSPIGTNEGMVIDVTLEPPLRGIVPDLRNPAEVEATLKQIFGVGEWGRRR